MKRLFAFLCILTMLIQPVSLPAEHDHAHAEEYTPCEICGENPEIYSWDYYNGELCAMNCVHGHCYAKEAHTWSDAYSCNEWGHDILCTRCRTNQGASSHEFGDTYEVRPEGHAKVCSVCDMVYIEKHSWGYGYDNEAGDRVHDCQTCGNTYPLCYPESCEHIWAEKPVSRDSAMHSHQCLLCGAYDEKVPHTPVYTGRGSDSRYCLQYTCADCGQNYSISHAFADNGDGTKTCQNCFRVADENNASWCDHFLNFCYETEDGHERMCTNCGTVYDQEDHNWNSNRNYDESGHWYMCGYCGVYSEVEAHVFSEYKESEWEHSGNGHYRECTLCDYEELIQGHVWTDGLVKVEGNNAHVIECTLCGRDKDYTWENHTLAEGYIITPYTHTTHCTVCDLDIETDLHSWNHSYTNEEGVRVHDCYTCGYTAELAYPESCEHVWSDTYESNDNDGHTRICMNCRTYEEPAAHTFVIESQSAQYAFVVCSVCGTGMYQYHTYELNDEGVLVCTTCGNTTTPYSDPATCDHSWNNYSVANEEGHKRICTACGTIYNQGEHTWYTGSQNNSGQYYSNGHSTYCTECGYQKAAEEHVWSEDYQQETDGHKRTCTVCNYTEALQAHVWSEDYRLNGSGHIKYCLICNYDNYDTYAEHTYQDGYIQTPYTHATHCTVCDLDVNVETHAWQNPYRSEDGKYVHECDICHYVAEVITQDGCEHVWEENSYQNRGDGHARYCIACNEWESVTQPHEWGETASDYGYYHHYYCELCGGQSACLPHTPETVTDEASGETYIRCSDCSRRADNQADACEHYYPDFGVRVQTENGHAVACAYCWMPGEETAHNFDSYLYNDENNHYYKCNDCGAISEITPHDWCDYDSSNANDIHHYRICNDCGHYSANEGHVWTDELVVADSNAHAYQCIVCGRNQASTYEAHEIVSGYVTTDYTHATHCTVCDKDVEVSFHSFGNAYEDENGQWMHACDTCGHVTAVVNPADCSHEVTTDDIIDLGHLGHGTRCAICQAYTPAVAHTWYETYSSTPNTHFLMCTICGYNSEEQVHTYGEAVDGIVKCTVCNRENNVYEGNCEHNWGSAYTTGNAHVWVCTNCGAVSEPAAHIWQSGYSYSSYNQSAGHWRNCRECGVSSAIAEHVWQDSYEANMSTHYRYCEDCGAQETHELHTWTDELVSISDNAHAIICTVCGNPKDGTYAEHTLAEDYTINEYTHSRYCSVCDEEAEVYGHYWINEHYDENNVLVHECMHCGKVAAKVFYDQCQHIWMDSYSNFGEVGHFRNCLICGEQSDVQPHVYETIQNEGAHHRYICSLCNHSGSEEAHIMDEGVKDVYGNITYTCPLCDAQYTASAGEVCEHEWDYTYIRTGEGHARTCLKCYAAEEFTPHTFGTYYTICDNGHGRTCTVCDFLEPLQSHVFEGNYNDNGRGHYRSCSVCNSDERLQAHQWSDGFTAIDKDYHGIVCTICTGILGNVEAHTDSGVNGTDEYYHWDICSVCNGPMNKALHSWGDAFVDEEGVNKHICSDCGLHGTVVDPATCEHIADYSRCKGVADNVHGYFCIACQTYAVLEEHTYVHDNYGSYHRTYCNVCSYMGENNGYNTHEVMPEFDENGNPIRLTCLYCSACITPADMATCNHVPDTSAYLECEGGHANVCLYCWKFLVSDHVWGDEYFYGGDEGHYRHCIYCGAQSDLEIHDLKVDYEMDPEGHGNRCTICNSVCNYVSHTWTEDIIPVEGTSYHARVCTVCGRDDDATFGYHTDADAYVIDAYYHTMLCDVCGVELSKNLHNWYNEREVDGVMMHDCYDCGYTAAVVVPDNCEHVWSYDRDDSTPNDGGHRLLCLACRDYSDTMEHSFNGDYFAASDYHRELCADCNHQGRYEAHVPSDITTDENGDIYATCSYCNYHYLYTDPSQCKHNSIGSTLVETENGTHGYVCWDCWLVVNEEAHTWTKGTDWRYDLYGHYHYCSECGARSERFDHNWKDGYHSNDDSSHYRYCADCNYYDFSSHEWSDSPVKINENQHAIVCTYCEGTKNGTIADHDAVRDMYDKEGHGTYCDTCQSKTVYEMHRFGVPYEEDGKMVYDCCLCDYHGPVSEPETCEHLWWYDDDYTDKEGHYGKCCLCGAISDVEAHTWVDYYHDSRSHDLRCDVCGYRDTGAAHTVSRTEDLGNGVTLQYCICGYTVQVEAGNTDCCGNGNTDNLSDIVEVEGGHARFCKVCWKQHDFEAHQWYENWSASERGHYKVCSVCYADSEVQPHEWNDSYYVSNDYHFRRCKDCYHPSEYQGHNWTQTPVSVPGNGHAILCTVCSNWKENTYADHQLSDSYTYDTISHWYDCPDCEGKVEENYHTWDNSFVNEDGEKVHTCSGCGITLAIVDPDTCEHIWSEGYYNAEGGHHRQCVLCQTYDELQDHNWEYSGDFYAYHEMYCITCNTWSISEPHFAHETQTLDDGTVRQTCICGYVTEVPAGDVSCHTGNEGNLSSDYYPTENGHARYCTVCWTVMEAEEHVWDDNYYLSHGDSHAIHCSLCSYRTPLEPHAWGDRYVSDTNEGHWKVCQLCFDTDAILPHNWSEDYVDITGGQAHAIVCLDCGYYKDGTEGGHFPKDGYQYDEFAHWEICETCNKKIYETDHYWGEEFEEDGVTKHTCYECRLTLPVPDPATCEHVWAEKCENQGHSGHARVCRRCGTKDALTAHVPSDEYGYNSLYHHINCADCYYSFADEAHSVSRVETDILGRNTYYCECGREIDVTSDPESCEHSWYERYLPTETGHYTFCTKCWTRSEEQPHTSEDNYKYSNHYQHYYYCDVCSTYYGFEDHTPNGQYDRWDTFHAERCSECDGNGPHEDHVWGTVLHPYGDGHAYLCEICKHFNSSSYGPHNYSGDYTTNEYAHYKTCPDCGDEIVASEHEWNDPWEEDGVWKHDCWVCGYVAETSGPSDDCDHFWGEAMETPDGEWLRECEYCGTFTYITNPHTCEHEWGDTYYSSGADYGHCLRCELCLSFSEDVPHTFDDYVWDDVFHSSCCSLCWDSTASVPHSIDHSETDENGVITNYCVCGYSFSVESSEEACEHEFYEDIYVCTDDMHYRFCNKCWTLFDGAEHTSTGEYFVIEGGMHLTKCSVCRVEYGHEKHVFDEFEIDDEEHGGICTVCKWKIWSKHIYPESAVTTAYNHTYACPDCGYIFSQGVHWWGNPYKDDVTGQMMHECLSCTAVFPVVSPDECDHYLLDNMMYTSTSHMDYCPICEETFNEEPHELVYEWIGDTHDIYCASCDYSESNLAHFAESTEIVDGVTMQLCPCGHAVAVNEDCAHDNYCYIVGDNYHCAIFCTDCWNIGEYVPHVINPDNPYTCLNCLGWIGGYLAQTITITQQPESVAVKNGEIATVTVETEGENLNYDWYVSYPGGNHFSYDSNFTGNTYSILMTPETDGTVVYCYIYNDEDYLYTENAILSMDATGPVITLQPEDVAVLEGEVAKVTIDAEGEGLTYEWYFKNKDAEKFTQTTSFTGKTYSIKMDETRDGRQVYCVITDVDGNQVTTETATLSMIVPVTITRQPVSVTVQEGEKATVSFDAAGDEVTYKWYFREKGSSKFSLTNSFKSNTYTVVMSEARDGREVYCVVTDKYGFTATTDTVSINIAAKLEITKQPVSVTVAEGKTAAVTVEAAGDDLTYAWYFRNKGAAKFSYTSSFQGNTYTTTMNDTRDGREVYCVITDAHGNSVTTDTVSINMEVKLVITQQPVSVTVKEGEVASTTVEATGKDLTYQWYYATKTGSTFYKASITTATYAVEMTPSRDGRRIYCVITDAYGNSVTSETVTLNMIPTLEITAQPEDVKVAEGQTVTLTVEATGEGLTYKWYYRNKNAAKFSYTSTFKGNIYTTEMSAARDGREVYCVIADSYGNSVQSETATISMAKALKITRQPMSVTVPDGEKATVTLGAEGEGLTYAWYFRNKGAAKFSYTSTFKTNTYSTTMDASRDGREVYCVVTDAYGNQVTTDTVSIGMTPTLAITRQPVSVSVFAGETAKVTVEAEGDDLTYAWYYKNKSAAKFSLTTSFTGTTYSVKMDATRDGRQVYCVVTDTAGNQITSEVATLSMTPSASITRQPVSVSVSAGETAKITLAAEGDGLTYAWYYKNKSAAKFSLTTSFTGTTYSVKMDATRDGRQVYCVVTDKYGNSVTSNTVTLSMENENALKITKQPTSVSVAAGETAKVSFTASGEGLTYTWYFKNSGASSFSKTSSFTGTSYSIRMDATRDGRQVYCVITDVDGNTLKTDTVTLSMAD